MLSGQKQRRLTSVQIVASAYVLLIMVSSVLLYIPLFHKSGVALTYLDALFIAASAVSVTGFSLFPIHEVFNEWGILFLTLLFQVGGIGVMTLGTFFWMLMGHKIGLEQRIWIATDHNRATLAGLVSLMRNIMILALLIELTGTLLLAFYFLISGYADSWWSAFYYGFFTAVSAFTNAGFDLHGTSLQGFAQDYLYQTIIMLLVVLGGIGFPVLVEARTYLAYRRARMRFSFSLFTKVTTLTFFSLIAVGALLFYLFEREGFLRGMSWHEALFSCLFHSVTSRSAGFYTAEPGLFSAPTLLLMCGLMFIGASPSSVGGGIRTTTFFVIVATVFAHMRGFKSVKAFGRELVEEDIMRSFLVFFVAVFLVFASTLAIVWLEGMPFHLVFFEVTSAFGTTGLSTGAIAEMGSAGKLILILMMAIGRIGIVNLLLLLKRHDQTVRYHHPKERIIIGQ